MTFAEIDNQISILLHVLRERGPTAKGAILWWGANPEDPRQNIVQLTPEAFRNMFGEGIHGNEMILAQIDEDDVSWCCSVPA